MSIRAIQWASSLPTTGTRGYQWDLYAYFQLLLYVHEFVLTPAERQELADWERQRGPRQTTGDWPGWARHHVLPPALPSGLPRQTKKKVFSQGRRQRVFARDGGRCLVCGCPDNLTLDHIMPESQGGGHGDDNLQTLCRTCNLKKGTRLPDA
jgi:HNH endonuclease